MRRRTWSTVQRARSLDVGQSMEGLGTRQAQWSSETCVDWNGCTPAAIIILATERPSDRATERSSDRAIERSSDRVTERSRDRNLKNNYLQKVHNSSSRASSDAMSEPSDTENCWVTLFTRIEASNDPSIVQIVTQNTNNGLL